MNFCGAVAVSVGSVRFQIAPLSSLHFSISIGLSGVVGVNFRDFNLLHQSFLKQFPLFVFCLPSLRCLISALTQADGGDLLFRFASSFQSCCGEGGACRQMSLCVGSTPRVPATLGLPRTGVSVVSPSTLLRLPAALYRAGPALSAVPVFRSSKKAWIRLRLRFVPSPA